MIPSPSHRRPARVAVMALLCFSGLGVVVAGAAPPPAASTQRTPPRNTPVRPIPTPTPTSKTAPTGSAAPTSSTAPTGTPPAPTGPADLRCALTAFGVGDTPVVDGGTAKPILEANGFHSFRYVLTVTNAGGATGAGFKVRYDYVQKIGGKTTTSTNGPITWGAFPAGGSGATPKLPISASGPYPNMHVITATLDVDGEVTESNEANNTCTFTVNLE